MTDKELMDKINVERKRKKITQEELAKMMGVTRTAINKWLNYAYYPTISDYLRLCSVLGLTLIVVSTDE